MSGLKKIVSIIFSLPSRCYNKIVLHYRKVEYKDDLVIHGRLKIFGHGSIRIGSGVVINSSMSSNPIGGDTRTVFSLLNSASLVIGDGTGISNATIVCHDRVEIGRRVQIGGSVKIYDTNFHSLEAAERDGTDMLAAIKKPVIIGDEAFIGAHSIILKGVTIGRRAIVGAGSVVTRDIPDGEVWGGNPAGPIRRADRKENKE